MISDLTWQALATLVALLTVVFVFWDMGETLLVALASTVQLAGFAMMLVNVLLTRSVSGLSRHSLLGYSVCFGLRAVLAVLFEGDTKVFKACEQFFILQEAMKSALAFYIYRLAGGRLRLSYDKALDQLDLKFLWVPVLLLSVVLHPAINGSFVADSLWAFTHYFEVVGLLPQLRLMRMKATGVERPLANFVLALVCSKTLDVVFWWVSYHDLNLAAHEESFSLMKEYVGHWFLLVQVVHLALGADFIWCYYQSMAGRRVQFSAV